MRTSIEYEKDIESKLKLNNPTIDWEVINQARTHLWHDRSPYKSTEDAIFQWVETATCIAIRLSRNNELHLIAPHGLNDIEQLVLRPVPSLKSIESFIDRIESKNWITKWPKLKVLIP